MLQLSQCRLHYKEDTREKLCRRLAASLRLRPEEVQELRIVKKSIDARKKPDIFVVYTVQFSTKNDEKLLSYNKNNKNLSRVQKEPKLEERIRQVDSREKILVAGTGPAGLFCAYYLSLCGWRPVLLERGAPMDERMADVESFWRGGKLKSSSNVSFGEGGAGTFSDGKLNTGVKDRQGMKRFILESFVRFGAGENILFDTKPHIGTDVLRRVIVAMRRELERRGCEFRFHTRADGLIVSNGRICGVETVCGITPEESRERMACDRLVLAVGHSARDTFSMLRDQGVAMSRKAFAVGVRVQHPQAFINMAQYGVETPELPPADYKCTGKTRDGRGVYTFCMCPGGYVVNASSEEGGLVVNGMSNEGRDSGYANSVVVVTVAPEDFAGDDVLAGVEFQRRYEKKMYDLAGGRIPVQRYGDFLADRESESGGPPCVKGEWCYGNIRKALPKPVVDGMIDGMEQFGRRLKGFDSAETLFLGLESRTSSPVRIERGEDLESLSVRGLYPCGEGAGYAGGIMSAAMDGLKVAMKIQDGALR